MNAKTLKDLGYFQVIEILKSFAQSSLGSAVCEQLLPYGDIKDALRESARTHQLKQLLKEGATLQLDEIIDVRAALRFARVENSVLDVDSIIGIGQDIAVARKIKRFIKSLDDELYPYITEFAQRLNPNEELERRIQKTIGKSKEILDTASEELYRVRSELRSKRVNIIGSLTDAMRGKENAPVIQDQVITVRNDRYVLVTKPNFNEHFKGIIHGSSQSGASYFVEPFFMVDDNNKLNLLVKEEKEEELNVLRSLTEDVRESADQIDECLNTLAEFDFLLAKAKLSVALNCSEAMLNKQGEGSVNLKNAYHPLLQFESLYGKNDDTKRKKVIVPINLTFAQDKHGMVISGPNSGGKTAALKTLGLASLMAKAGLHILADEGSSLLFFDKIFADIGDEQDILKEMGTFSSHLANLKGILDTTDKNTLVLLDELGTGTNPSEGAALFSAVLDYLLDTGCNWVVTTHLDKIKHYAYIKKNVENVSVAFNESTLKPEFKLIYNQIGESNAINLARQIGIKESILGNAKKYLTDEELKFSQLLKELSAEKALLAKEREEVEEIKREAANLKEQRERMLSKIREKQSVLIKNKEQEISNLFYETKLKLKGIVKKHKEDKATDIQAFEEVTVLKKEVAKTFFTSPKKGKNVEKLQVGDSVFLENFKDAGVVLKIDDKRQSALVSVGNMKFDIPLGGLTKKEQAQSEPKKESGSVRLHKEDDSTVREINVIGMTVDEALPIIDKFLDEAYLSNLSEVTIIHGKGTGRLRDGILKHLKHAPYVLDIPQGKDLLASAGATTVRIKL